MGYDASLCVRGIRPPDATWKKMKAAYEACEAADLEVPDEVQEFFDYGPPEDGGMCVNVPLEDGQSDAEGMTTDVRGGSDTASYYLVDLAKLPKNITHLKVWISESY